MSFVKKWIKKKWKFTKRVVKSKIFKYIVIAAAIVFTAGIATVGFAAFAGVSSVGGFFGAVGTTMAVGAGTLTGGAIGIAGSSVTGAGTAAAGTGLAASGGAVTATEAALATAGAGEAAAGLAAAGGAAGGAAAAVPAATTGGVLAGSAAGGSVGAAGTLAGAGVAGAGAAAGGAAAAVPAATGGGLLSGAASGVGGGGIAPATSGALSPIEVSASKVAGGTFTESQFLAAGGTTAGGAPAGGGFWQYTQQLLSKPMLGDITAGQLITTGLTTAFSSMLTASQREEQERANGYVAGGLFRGGPKDAPPAYTWSRQSSVPSSGQGGGAEVTSPDNTLAGTLAKQEAPVLPAAQGGLVQDQDTSGADIRGLIRQRGPLVVEQPSNYGYRQGVSDEQQQPKYASTYNSEIQVELNEQSANPNRVFQDRSSPLVYKQGGLI